MHFRMGKKNNNVFFNEKGTFFFIWNNHLRGFCHWNRRSDYCTVVVEAISFGFFRDSVFVVETNHSEIVEAFDSFHFFQFFEHFEIVEQTDKSWTLYSIRTKN